MALMKRTSKGQSPVVSAPAQTPVSEWTISDLSALYAQERSALTGVARRMLRSDLYAEEIVQEAFLKFMLAAPELDSRERAIAYLRTTVNNLCLNHIRATGTRPNLVAIDADSSQERINEISALEHVPFDSTLAAAEDAAIIREALARLSQDQRTALVMWEMEGRSTEEIATAIGTTPANVRHVVSRARAAFVRTLSEWVVDEENGTTALQALSTSYKKAAELAKKSSKVALSIVLLVAAFVGFTSLKNNVLVNKVHTALSTSTKVTTQDSNNANQNLTIKNLSNKNSTSASKNLNNGISNNSSKNNATNSNNVVNNSAKNDVKNLSSGSVAALKVVALNFPGLDANGVPFGFTVTNSAGQFGDLRSTTPVVGADNNGATVSTILTTVDANAPYALIQQTLTLNGSSVAVNLDPLAVSVKGVQYPVIVTASHSTMSRLDDGSFLITSSNVTKLDTSAGTIGGSPANVGVDLTSAPTQIITRIHLSPSQTKILGQAVDIVTKQN